MNKSTCPLKETTNRPTTQNLSECKHVVGQQEHGEYVLCSSLHFDHIREVRDVCTNSLCYA